MKLNLEDKEFILANGVKEDSDKLWALLKDQPTPVPGVVIEATASVLRSRSPRMQGLQGSGLIVNMKKPLDDKDIPAIGSQFKLMSEGGPELDGTYDTFTLVPPQPPRLRPRRSCFARDSSSRRRRLLRCTTHPPSPPPHIVRLIDKDQPGWPDVESIASGWLRNSPILGSSRAARRGLPFFILQRNSLSPRGFTPRA